MTFHDPAAAPSTTFLKDYRSPDYLVDTVNLQLDLDEKRTNVKSVLIMRANDHRPGENPPLVLNGKGLILKSLLLNGKQLKADRYAVDDEHLTITNVPEHIALEIETECEPAGNTELSGLYFAGNMFCTQCEAEGFRKITYYPDRPDVLARFFTTIVADKKKYPVLLSNGNLIGKGDLPDGRHFAKWHDPFPKPAYLFALVGGDLSRIEDRFTTMSGREVSLHIYVQHHNKEKCGHAMESLKQAMKWDEVVYGREYDLDLFMIVATDDFNMGAMENKGLNIFNSKYVLADAATATDGDYQGIMGVVAHEYFHNWSGDRVTCRDWFQLSLKEGFTVFRDQQFMEDLTSAGVRRIGDANLLRAHQFREDSGPMAHSVRPDSYVEINNFYTMTVYNKGAEVIRMMRTLLGPEGFRKGTDLYFGRHDGQAVTTDDFVKALEDATGVDLSQFRLWYTQAGTPELTVSRRYDTKAMSYELSFKQSCSATPGQPVKQPFHIPIAVALIGKDSRELELKRQGGTTLTSVSSPLEGEDGRRGGILELRNESETFVFTDVPEEPVPSILRGFSAPVKVKLDLTDEERLFLMAHDRDPFNRWDAGQQLAVKLILDLVKDRQEGKELVLDNLFIDAFRATLEGQMEDKAFQAFALSLPSESYLADFMAVIDPEAIHEARKFVQQTLAAVLKDSLLAVYRANIENGPYLTDQASVGKRSLRNTCLGLLSELEDDDVRELCLGQYRHAGNMTDAIAALVDLANSVWPEREEALASFHEKWKDDTLVMDKWLAIQATSRLSGALDRVKALVKHPVFNIKNPNKVRALIGAFASNSLRYHDQSGEGYAFIADQVLVIDPMNPQIAARLVSAFTLWKRYDERRQALMRRELERIAGTPKLSKDVHEVVSKSLA
jgi:aminopeptidase N